jgi:hypothetical protein
MVLIDVTGVLATMTEKGMTQAIRAKGGAKYTEAMTQLKRIRFARFAVDAGTVHNLKTIISLRTTPHYPIQSIILALRENTNFRVCDYAAVFVGFFSSAERFHL